MVILNKCELTRKYAQTNYDELNKNGAFQFGKVTTISNVRGYNERAFVYHLFNDISNENAVIISSSPDVDETIEYIKIYGKTVKPISFECFVDFEDAVEMLNTFKENSIVFFDSLEAMYVDKKSARNSIDYCVQKLIEIAFKKNLLILVIVEDDCYYSTNKIEMSKFDGKICISVNGKSLILPKT